MKRTAISSQSVESEFHQQGQSIVLARIFDVACVNDDYTLGAAIAQGALEGELARQDKLLATLLRGFALYCSTYSQFKQTVHGYLVAHSNFKEVDKELRTLLATDDFWSSRPKSHLVMFDMIRVYFRSISYYPLVFQYVESARPKQLALVCRKMATILDGAHYLIAKSKSIGSMSSTADHLYGLRVDSLAAAIEGVSQYLCFMKALAGQYMPILGRHDFSSTDVDEQTIQEMDSIVERPAADAAFASEMRSHLEILKKNRASLKAEPRLRVVDANLHWYLGFFIDAGSAKGLIERASRPLSENSHSSGLVGRMSIPEVPTLEGIYKPSLSDIFETPLGMREMDRVVLAFSPIQIRKIGASEITNNCEIDVSVQLFSNGVGIIEFRANQLPTMSIDQVRLMLSLISPSVCYYQVVSELGKYGGLLSYCKTELLPDVVTVIKKCLRSRKTRRISARDYFDDAWFACVVPNQLTSSGDLETFSRLMEQTPVQLGALANQARADKVSIDDSYAFVRMTNDQLKAANLAFIRSFPEDTVFFSSNQAVIYTPHCPTWGIDDYLRSAQLILAFKVLIANYERLIDDVIRRVRKIDNWGSRRLHNSVVRLKRNLTEVLNATNPAKFTRYPDHAQFFLEIYHRTNLQDALSVSRDKLSALHAIRDEIQQSASLLIRDILLFLTVFSSVAVLLSLLQVGDADGRHIYQIELLNHQLSLSLIQNVGISIFVAAAIVAIARVVDIFVFGKSKLRDQTE